jgi:hypothetical protein
MKSTVIADGHTPQCAGRFGKWEPTIGWASPNLTASWLLDPLAPAVLEQFLAHPLGTPFPLTDVLGQPRAQLVRVGHRALAELTNLGAVVFHRAPAPLVERHVRRGNLDLARDVSHRLNR